MTLFATVTTTAERPSLMIALVVALEVVSNLRNQVPLTYSGGGVLSGRSTLNGRASDRGRSRGNVLCDHRRLCWYSGGGINIGIQGALRWAV